MSEQKVVYAVQRKGSPGEDQQWESVTYFERLVMARLDRQASADLAAQGYVPAARFRIVEFRRRQVVR